MRSGVLRHVITIRQRATGQNEIGEPASTWTDVATDIRAWVQDLSGRELLAAQATQNPVNAKILIRYRPGITAAMQVVFGEVTYNIETVIDPTRNKARLELMCVRL